MHVLGKDRPHFFFDKNQPPVLRVRPGEEVVFETLDTCSGQVRDVESLRDYWRRKHPSNALTGPVYVEGAKAGGVLVVEILGIELDPIGFHLIGPNRGVIRDEVKDWTHFEVRTDGRRVWFGGDERWSVPADPVIGALGNAPAGEPTNAAGRGAATSTCRRFGPGARCTSRSRSTALAFSLGDVHACQGDGELVGAPEIGATVHVRFAEVLSEPMSGWVMIEEPEAWSIVTVAKDEAQAIRTGAVAAGRWLSGRISVPFERAMILLGSVCRIRCSRTGLWGTQGAIVTISWPKSLESGVRQPVNG